MPNRVRLTRSLTLTVACALFMLNTGLRPSVISAQGSVADVSGTWTWNEYVIFTGPGPAITAFFQVQLEGPVMHVRCDTWGGLTIQQNGPSFTGFADQQWACVTQGGQTAQSAPFPPGFSVSGEITGRGVHFVADVGQGFSCSYDGSLRVAGGVATSLNATGGCDVPMPFHPNMDRSISFDATRQ